MSKYIICSGCKRHVKANPRLKGNQKYCGSIPGNLINGGISIPNFGDIDLNEKVQAYDASLLLKYLVEEYEFNEAQQYYSDVSGDSTLSALDASIILRYVVGAVDELPYNGSSFEATGDFQIADVNVNAMVIINIPVKILNGEDLYSIAGKMEYDPEILHFYKVANTTSTDSCIFSQAEKSEKVTFGGSGSQPVNGTDEIMMLQFKLHDGASADQTIIKLKGMRLNENENSHKEINYSLNLDEITGKNRDNETPNLFVLEQKYPNPFNPTTTISYYLPETANVTLTIYNSLIEKIKAFDIGHQNKGRHNYNWNAESFSSGIYLYRIKAGEFNGIKKALLLK